MMVGGYPIPQHKLTEADLKKNNKPTQRNKINQIHRKNNTY